MKTFRSCFLGILVCGLPCAFAQTRAYSHLASLSESKAAAPALAAKYGQLPLIFEANQGQTDSRVRFTSRGYGYSLFLTDKEAVLALRKNPGHAMGRVAGFPHKPKRGLNGAPEAVKTDVVRMQLAGTAAGLKVSGEEQLPGTANYFIGNDPAKWHSNVSTYSKVKYAGVYPGVDLVYYGNQRQLEYDFVVAPGADPNQVKLRFAGASRLKLNADGDLMVMAKNGEIAFHKPVVYQLKSEQLSSAQQGAGSASERVVVEGRFVLLAGKTAKFSLGDYDRSRELVIDPTLAYSTYLGGSGGDEGIAIAVDNSGNAYVLGNTSSIDFPITKGSFQPVDNGAADHIPNVFVTKLNPSGTALVYSSYLGGSGLNGGNGDFGSGIAVDSSGNAYATGYTWSSDFPVTKGAFQPVNNAAATQGTNAFVTKLNSSGTTLVFSTYVGGSGVLQSAGFGYPGYGDSGNSIAADSLGNAYVTGSAYSVDFPVTKGAFQQVNNAAAIKASNAFAIKLNETGTALLYSTYLGGSGGRGGDTGSGIAIDAFGSAYLTGYAWSTDFPVTEGAFQAANNAAANKSINAFVTKLSSSGSSLLLSTYLGGSFGDAGAGIAVDTCGSAYVTGTAFSRDFPVTPGAFQTVFRGQGSGFISKLTPSGSSLLYSTFLGGSSYGTQASGIAVGLEGNAYVTGYSSSSDFPVTTGAFQAVNNAANNPSDPFPGAANDFMTELNPAGTALIYSTYLGGKGDNFGDGDHGQGVALDASGNVYLTGLAASLDFPVTKGAFQTVNHSPIPSSGTAFVAKFSMGSEIATTTSLMSDGNPQGAGVKVIFTAYVAPSTGSQVPTGTVGFAIDGGSAVVVTLDGTGHATYSTSSLVAGRHRVVASYSGDSLNVQSSATLSQTIYAAAPFIEGINTTYGAPYSVIYLSGTGFGASQGGSTIAFNGIAPPVYYWSNTNILATVPPRATTGDIVATVNGVVSNPIAFNVLPMPMLTGISPPSGPVGTIVTISGKHLLDLENHATVTFNGKSLPILSRSSTTIQVAVPSGAVIGHFHVLVDDTGMNTPTFTVAP